MFCGCSANYAGAAPNTHVCPTCLGLPGSLPVINQRAIEKVALTGLALNAEIDTDSLVSRKNYTYPDLPSAYQRSQYEDPLCKGGWLTIRTEKGETKKIGITRIHLEEDTGKLTHAADGSSLIDYNRSGTPLMEIVSEPDISSPEEAKLYFQKLRQILLWIGVNSGNMEDGALRCDANVSVRPVGQKEYGAKVEIKNINSFRFVERALTYEIQRQIELIEDGGKVVQETRLYDANRDETRSMRTKEEANDYRYFPDPDLLPLEITPAFIDAVRETLPELPDAKRARFMSEYGLSAYDAEVLTATRELADYYEHVVQASGHQAKPAANWVMVELSGALNKAGLDITESPVTAQMLGQLLKRIQDGTISGKIAKDVFEAMWNGEGEPDAIIEQRGLKQVTDIGAIEAIVDQVIAANPAQVEQYKAGKEKVLGFFVGQAMKLSQGKANPAQLNELLRRKLGPAG